MIIICYEEFNLYNLFQDNRTSGHAMRLNSWTSIEGSPVSSLNCNRPLDSGIMAVMSVGY